MHMWGFGDGLKGGTTMLTHVLRRIAISLRRVGAFFVVLLCLSLVWSWWEVGQVRAYCASVVPGTPVSALPDLTEQFGFRRFGKSNDAQPFLVPTYTALGLFTCVIRHDGVVVISAKVDES